MISKKEMRQIYMAGEMAKILKALTTIAINRGLGEIVEDEKLFDEVAELLTTAVDLLEYIEYGLNPER